MSVSGNTKKRFLSGPVLMSNSYPSEAEPSILAKSRLTFMRTLIASTPEIGVFPMRENIHVKMAQESIAGLPDRQRLPDLPWC